MSQGSQGSFAPTRIVLPLSKFSYATVHGESITPIPWIHLGRNSNLFAIFETQRVEDSNGQTRDVKYFRVLQDPNVLEDIDLDVLAGEANRAKLEAQDPRMDGKVPSVTVIVKIPCIAVRYPLEGGQIRRMQIRLASNDDYYEILKIFTRAGVPFGDAGSFPPQQPPPRPFSSSSSLLRPSDSASQLGVRPVSVSSNLGDLSSIRAGASAGWGSSNSMRPATSSGPVCGSSSGIVSSYFGQPTRHPEMADESGIAFNGSALLNIPANGLVSGYVAGQTESRSTKPRPESASGYVSTHGLIDLYQPRPSSAPFLESSRLTNMLPPKRDLPFSKPTPAKRARKGSPKPKVEIDTQLSKPYTCSSYSDLGRSKASASDAISALTSASQNTNHSAATLPAAKGKSTVVSRVPKSRATKKQQAEAPAKKASKDTTEEEIVPSVEQLLKGIEEHWEPTVETPATIDTQALLSRVEATKLFPSVETPKIPQKQYVQSELSAQAGKCNTCWSRKGKCNGQQPCDWCADINVECTYDAPAEPEFEVSVPLSQPEAVVEFPTKSYATVGGNTATPHQKAPVSEEHVPQGGPLQQLESPPTPQDRGINPDATLINVAPPTLNPATTSNSTNLHLSTDANPLALLLRQPDFAQSDGLTSWASLPASAQRSTLDTWMCQQLADPGFVALVKIIDESWQANLFGRSVGID